MKTTHDLAGLIRSRREALLVAGLLGVAIAVGIWRFIVPLFGEFAPVSPLSDFISHVAIVTGALDTMVSTGAFPISTDTIRPGVEYPYYLFGNAGFYVSSAIVSLALGVPAYIGMGTFVALAYALGVCGMFVLLTGAGLNRYASVFLGFLYASGPYMSLNLSIRVAFPEYVTWQVSPILLLALMRGLRRESGAAAVFGAAFALATPFYLHKLVGPYLVLTLGALALNGSRLTTATLTRLAVIGAIAVCLSVPSWLPTIRGLDPGTVRALAIDGRPRAFHPNPLNLFWPYAENSLPDEGDNSQYEGRFALQVGIVPTVGFLAAVLTVLTQPRLALSRRLLIPLALFLVYVALVLGRFGVWELMPAPFRYIQYTYRLIGLAHFIGFILFAQALGSPRHKLVRHSTPLLRRLIGVQLAGLAVVSILTYWHAPAYTPMRSADIQARNLVDLSQFFARSGPGRRPPGVSLQGDMWLTVPPMPLAVAPGAPSLILTGAAPPALFAQSPEPLVVRIYGFAEPGSRTGAGTAAMQQLPGVLREMSQRSPAAAVAPIGAFVAESGAAASGGAVPLPNAPWTVTLLAETSVSGPGAVELQAPLTEAVSATAVECSRAVPVEAVNPAIRNANKVLCINASYLTVPNEGTRFIPPIEVPVEVRTRRAFGTWSIDARGLAPGHYLLPTLDYSFVRVTDSDGASVPTYQFDARPVIRHTGSTDSYVVSYSLVPELMGLLGGIGLFAAYALVSNRGRWPRHLSRRWSQRRPLVQPAATMPSALTLRADE